MSQLLSSQDRLLRAVTAQRNQMNRTHQLRRSFSSLINPKSSYARYYCLHFAANISASCFLLKRKGKYISESESTDSSDNDDDKYPVGRDTVVYEPHVVEFPSYAAMEEEKFFHELLAFPWQRGRTERFQRRLERKYFPNHGLDSMLLPAYRNKTPESSSAKSPSAVATDTSGFPDDRVYKKLDYPTIAKALRPGADGQESFRSQRSRPSFGKKTYTVDGESFTFDTTPTIRTIRAPLSGCDDLSSPSALPDSQAEAASSGEDIDGSLNEIQDNMDWTSSSNPLLIRFGMDLPKYWNTGDGTVVLIDKPKGWTSFSVCDKIRKLVRVKKVGHAGTLDPMATGLLVVCVGRATKLADRYQALTKVYTGTFRLGEATSSCDADLPVNERKPWKHITDTQVQNVKDAFIGEIMQIPPMFSAIKVNGERLYEKARRGEHLDVPARKVRVYDFRIERNKEDRQELDFYVRCSKGTYVRSLCADLARALNSCAHLTRLRREKIGDLSVDDAWEFQDMANKYSSLYMSQPLRL